MSSGGRVQLAAQGAQDIFLTGNPTTTYFLKRYSKHTRFAIQTGEVPLDQNAVFGSRTHATIPRIGDLVKEMYFKFTLPELNQGIFKTFDTVTQSNINVNTFPSFCDSIGNAIVRSATLKIGQQTIQTINGEYMEIYNDMFIPTSQSQAINQLTGRTYSRTGLGPASNVVYRTQQSFDAVGAFPRTFIVPLRFFFTQDPNLSIPLTSLYKQEVQVEIEFENLERLLVNTQKLRGGGAENLNTKLDTLALGDKPITIINPSILCDYIFLSEEEGDFFRNTSQDYLITQLQGIETTSSGSDNFTKFPKHIRTYFKNPVKELYIIVQEDEKRRSAVSSCDSTTSDYFNFTSSSATNRDNLSKLELLFNGNTRIDDKIADSLYLRVIQPLQSHTKPPERFVYNYSFSLDSENYQPTGQVNFSRIKDVMFNVFLNPALNQNRNIRIYAKNYNVLRVESGMAGMLFDF